MNPKWVGLISGAWLIISPWVLGFSEVSLAKWSSVLVGLMLASTYIWDLFADKKEIE